MRFALVPIISGTFVVSTHGPAAPVEWGHIICGFALLYLIFGLLLRSAKYPELRLPGAVAMALGLLEAIPGVPRLHAAVSPALFAALVCTALARPDKARAAGAPAAARVAQRHDLRVFLLPALVMLPIVYGVGYRHQTSGFWPHAGAALLAAGVLLVFCLVMIVRHPDDTTLRGASYLTMAAVLFQFAVGFATLVIRILELPGGLPLALARMAHVTGAAPLLGATTMLAIQYRRGSAA